MMCRKMPRQHYMVFGSIPFDAQTGLHDPPVGTKRTRASETFEAQNVGFGIYNLLNSENSSWVKLVEGATVSNANNISDGFYGVVPGTGDVQGDIMGSCMDTGGQNAGSGKSVVDPNCEGLTPHTELDQANAVGYEFDALSGV